MNNTDAFANAPIIRSRCTMPTKPTSTSLWNSRNSPGFVGFSGDDNPVRFYDSSSGGQGRSVSDPFSSPSAREGAWQEPQNAYGQQVYNRPNNLSPYSNPNMYNQERYAQRNYPSARIQGGSRQTYAHSPQTYVTTDGRPLHVEMEVYNGPNDSPTRVKMYSEDGRQRPMNVLTNNNFGGGYGGGVVSVRNVGSMEFPMDVGVGSGGYGGYDNRMGGAPMMNSWAQNNDMRPNFSSSNGFIAPSTARGETVQGGALKTFSLPHSVNAVQVTITSDGLPVNAKVELWGTSSHVKQLAEVYNDNGQTRPFAAIIDVPGGENTIAVRNTGPMEYPIRVVVEPVGLGMGMENGDDAMGGWDPPMLPGEGMMMDGPMMLPPGPEMMPPPW